MAWNWKEWMKEKPRKKRDHHRDGYHGWFLAVCIFLPLLLWATSEERNQGSFDESQIGLFWSSVMLFTAILVNELYSPMRFVSTLVSVTRKEMKLAYETKERIARGIVFGLSVIGFFVVDTEFMRETEWLKVGPVVALALFQIIRGLVLRVYHWMKTGE
jgi:hypothetical protein